MFYSVEVDGFPGSTKENPYAKELEAILAAKKWIIIILEVHLFTPPNFRVYVRQKVPEKCFAGTFKPAQTLKLRGVSSYGPVYYVLLFELGSIVHKDKTYE